MTKETTRYSSERAQAEANEMQEKLQRGAAGDYPEAEKRVEARNARDLQRTLGSITLLEKGERVDATYSDLAKMMQHFHPDLTEAALKVEFQNAIDEIQKVSPEHPDTSTGQLVFDLGLLYSNLRSDITDPGLHSVGAGLTRLRAKSLERDRDYVGAAEEYEAVGLSDQAEDARRMSLQHPNADETRKKLGRNNAVLSEEIRSFQDYTKKHPLITKDERAEILNTIKNAIQSDLDDLKVETNPYI